MNSKQNHLLVLLTVILLIIALLALFIGPHGWSLASSDTAILHYRLNRIVLAIIAGSSLAASGASLQSIFRNPLADPHIFGISGGAALGACLLIAFEHTCLSPSLGAIIGGLGAFLLIFYYLNRSPFESLSGCLLIGVLINSTTAAIISLLKVLLSAHKTHSLLYWLVGHINAVENNQLFIIIPLWMTGLFILLSIRHELEILSFGQLESLILGINYNSIIKLAIIANCILIGNTVAFAGMIGFIGLAIPNLLRVIVFPDLRIILPVSALVGAIILVFFDSLSRLSFLVIGTELPVGVLTALFLSPVLFFILIGSKHEL